MKRLILLSLLVPLLFAPTAHADTFLNNVNGVRAAAGVNPVTENSILDAAASARAQDMCAQNYWGHESPQGNHAGYFTQQAGYKPYSYYDVTDNLAYGSVSADQTVALWTNSPGHYAAMVGNFNELGVGAYMCPSYQGFENQTIWVNIFAGPLGYSAKIPTSVSPSPAAAPVVPVVTTTPPVVVSTKAPVKKAVVKLQHKKPVHHDFIWILLHCKDSRVN